MRLRSLLTDAPDQHANTFAKSASAEVPSLHDWLGGQLKEACAVAAAAARTLCDDLPSALQKPGAQERLRSLQDDVSELLSTWGAMGTLDTHDVEVS